MFTGIIEAIGTVTAMDRLEGGRRLHIDAPFSRSLEPGQSVNVDGACLTVEETDPDQFTVFLAAETVTRTRFDSIESGDRVNLERGMPADGRFDGHLVQGHVDATIPIVDIRVIGEDQAFEFELPASLKPYVVEKGSIAIDGISLTVADRTEDTFSIAIIPTTLEETTLSGKEPGDVVHVETDLFAKYVESILESDYDSS